MQNIYQIHIAHKTFISKQVYYLLNKENMVVGIKELQYIIITEC